MKSLVIFALLLTLGSLAHAAGRVTCEGLFRGEHPSGQGADLALDHRTELAPIEGPVAPPVETKLAQLERIIEAYLDPAFQRISDAMNDGELDMLLRHTNTEVNETNDVAQRLTAAYKSFELRQRATAMFPKLRSRLMSAKFQERTTNELERCRATSAACEARLAHRAQELKAKAQIIFKLDAELERRANRVKQLLRSRNQGENLGHAASFLDGVEVTHELIVAVIASLRMHHGAATTAGAVLSRAVDTNLNAMELKGLPATEGPQTVHGQFDRPLVTLRQLEVLAEIERHASKKNYKLEWVDVESLGQIEGVEATKRLLWLLTKPSAEHTRARAIQLLGQRRYFPETYEALHAAWIALKPKEQQKLLEVYLMRDPSSAATEQILRNAFIYHYEWHKVPHVESTVALARPLGEEHVETIMKAFEARSLLNQERYPRMRIEIIDALARIGGPKARAGLEYIITGEWCAAYFNPAKPLPYATEQSRARNAVERDRTIAQAREALERISP